MAQVLITRSKAAVAVRRDAVKTGQAFRLKNKDGSLGEKVYGHVGRNGKNYSINLESGEVSSSANDAKQVVVVGKFSLTQHRFASGQEIKTTREGVQDNQVFRAKGGSTLYANMGKLKDGRFASINLSDWRNDNYAVTNVDDRNVEVVGNYSITAEVAS